jgi:hypothetical protein
MTNETYRYAFMKSQTAIDDIESSALLFVRGSGLGKTDTAKVLVKNIRKAVFVPVISTAYQRSWFEEQLNGGTQVFILDDPAAWTFFRKDLTSCILVLKNLVAGEFRAARGTKYDVNYPERLYHEVCVMIFSNQLQYSDIKLDLDKSGLGARLEKFLTTHTNKHAAELKKYYKTHKLSSRRNILPEFRIDITDIIFSEEFMDSGRKGQYYNEEILFYDPDDKQSDETEQDWIARMEKKQ